MFIRTLSSCTEITAGDNTKLRELFNPLKDKDLNVRYSLAHAIVGVGQTTFPHKLKTSEAYYILEGQGLMHIDGEEKQVKENDFVYIPPHAVQKITNTGKTNLVFLCIVDPAWKLEDEEVIN